MEARLAKLGNQVHSNGHDLESAVALGRFNSSSSNSQVYLFWPLFYYLSEASIVLFCSSPWLISIYLSML